MHGPESGNKVVFRQQSCFLETCDLCHCLNDISFCFVFWHLFWGNSSSREIQALFCKATSTNSSRGDTKTFLNQLRDIISPERRPRGILTRCLNPLNWLLSARSPSDYSKPLPDVQAPHPISKAEPSHPVKEADIRCLYLQSHSFFH